MDVLDQLGLGQAEDVVVTFEITFVGGEKHTPKVFLGQSLLLDHRAHGAIQHADALAAKA